MIFSKFDEFAFCLPYKFKYKRSVTEDLVILDHKKEMNSVLKINLPFDDRGVKKTA